LFGEFPVKPPAQAADVFDSMVVRMVELIVGDDDPMRDDLLSVGRRALADAVVAHSNAPRTVPFRVFATWSIRDAVQRQYLELLEKQRADRRSEPDRKSAPD
jgi:hypothetical protein